MTFREEALDAVRDRLDTIAVETMPFIPQYGYDDEWRDYDFAAEGKALIHYLRVARLLRAEVDYLSQGELWKTKDKVLRIQEMDKDHAQNAANFLLETAAVNISKLPASLVARAPLYEALAARGRD